MPRSFKDEVVTPYFNQPDPRGERINNLQHDGMSWRGHYSYQCMACGTEWMGYGELRPECPTCG